MDILKFGTFFFLVAAVVFHLIGHDALAFCLLEASVFFFLMHLVDKSEKK